MATRRAEPALKAAQLEPASPQPRTMGPPASRAVMTSSKTSNAAKAGRSKGKAKSNHLEDVLVKRESHLARGLEEARERERQRLKDLEEAARLSREERIRKIQDKMVPRFMRATQASKAKDLTGLGQAPLPKVELPPEPIKPKPRPDVWKGQGLGDVLVPHRSKLETEIAKARAQAAAKAAGSDADADADAAAQAEAEAEAEAEAAAAAAAASGKAPDSAPRRMPRYMRPTQAFESFVGKTATTTSSDKSVSADAQPINSSTSTSASSPEPAAPESTVEEAAGKEAGLKLEEEGLDAAENDEQADPNCGVNAPGEDEESNKGFVSRAALKHQEAWGEGGLGDVLVKHKSRLQREQEAWYASQLADTHRPVPDNVSADPAAAGATAATTDEPAANGSSTGDAQA